MHSTLRLVALAAVALELGSCLSYVIVFRHFFPEPPRADGRRVAWLAMGAGAVLPGGNIMPKIIVQAGTADSDLHITLSERVAAANGLVFWTLATDGTTTLGQKAAFAQAAIGTSLLAFGGLNWALPPAIEAVRSAGRLARRRS